MGRCYCRKLECGPEIYGCIARWSKGEEPNMHCMPLEPMAPRLRGAWRHALRLLFVLCLRLFSCQLWRQQAALAEHPAAAKTLMKYFSLCMLRDISVTRLGSWAQCGCSALGALGEEVLSSLSLLPTHRTHQWKKTGGFPLYTS